MARPTKETVDYFPHRAKHGTGTLAMLERKWKNDGYALWFKLLELLASSDGHVYDCSDPDRWENLAFYSGIDDEQTIRDILDKLAAMKAIDTELWQKHKIVWIQKFVDGIAYVYERRKTPVPQRPIIGKNKGQGNPKPDKKTALAQTNGRFNQLWIAYPKKKSKGQAETTFFKIDPDDDLLEVMLRAIEKARISYDWTKDNGQYIPHLSTWLNAKGWEDEIKGANNGKHEKGIGKVPRTGEYESVEEYRKRMGG